jgi:hypothetical protein
MVSAMALRAVEISIPKLPPAFTPELLNQLYREHETSEVVGRQEWFRKRLESLGLAEYQRAVEETFAVVLGASYVFLGAYPGGAVNSDKLWAENDAVIMRESPWLDDANLGAAQYWSRYYAWHDGLVKSR